MNRIWRFLASLCLTCPMLALAQSAQLSGVVKDKTGAVVTQANVTLKNIGTASVLHTTTSKVGFFIFSSVQAGQYNLSAEAAGFDKTLIQNIKVDVAANVSQDMILQVKRGTEQIIVAENPQLNDTDGTVSTVLPHELIENLPLNGNDLQTLFEVTPGTLLNAGSGSADTGGGFSVDGQRDTANYTTVDGVSANAYVPTEIGSNVLGSGIATSASGGTNGILPVDAIEEYRMDTSTYTAENGRTPGGQIQIRTRSGTNQFHGTLFENFRNQILDANDWFSNYDHNAQAQLRMNEFGGTLGGPVVIPHLFDGQNRLFFFVSNDNLIFDQPNTETQQEVPDVSVRSGAYSVFKAWLPVFPAGNDGYVSSSITSFDYLNFSSSDQIRDYTTSVRIDAQLPRSMHAFFRANVAPSSASEENVGDHQGSTVHINTYTAGLTIPVGDRIVNELTGNYTSNNTEFGYSPASLGGNNPYALEDNLPNGVNLSSDEFTFFPYSSGYSADSLSVVGPGVRNEIHLWNVVDVFGFSLGKNNVRIGVDFLKRNVVLFDYATNNNVYVEFPDAAPYTASDLDTGVISELLAAKTISNPNISVVNTSVFVNDSWKASSSLTLNTGLRWELDPSPTVGPLGTLSFADNNTDLATFRDTISTAPLYRTVYSNIAPRFGFAWAPRQLSGTVIRGGAGIYFDTGQAATAAAATAGGYPYQYNQTLTEVPYNSVDWTDSAASSDTQSLTNFSLVSPKLLSPRTYEWSLTLDQSFGKSTKWSASYVGNDGEKLVGEDEYYNAKNSTGQYPFPTTTVQANGYFYLVTNRSHSNYQALQTQLTSRAGQRLTALVSYTWDHAEDNGSSDFASASANMAHNPMADSAFDIRQMFSTAIHYSPEGLTRNRLLKSVTGGWALDSIARLQSASPVTVIDASTNQIIYGFSSNANVVQGVSAVLHEHMNNGTVVPGNTLLNWKAFTAPTVNSSGVQTSNGDSPTNGFRLFGLKQWDLAVSRSWKIWGGVNLHFRVDAFNLLNTPNFYIKPQPTWSPSNSATFGRATATYASGYGGSVAGDGETGAQLTAFQNGGPRELQLSMKLKF